MADLNKVFIIGNLTRDPELRYTPQGTAVVTLRIAANTRFRAKDSGEMKKETCFINVVAWGNLAEICNQYLQKGRPVFIEGRLQSRNWQDQAGKNRSTIEIRAERVQFLGRAPESSSEESFAEADLGPAPADVAGPASEEAVSQPEPEIKEEDFS